MAIENNDTQVAAETDGFEENWQQFLSHNFGEETVTASDEGSTLPAGAGNDSVSGADTQPGVSGGGQGNDAPLAPSGQDTIASSGQDSAAAPASDSVPGGGAGNDQIEPTVAPELIAAMMGLGSPPSPAPQGTTPAAPGGSESPAQGDGSGAKDEPFMPFQPTFKLQPELVSALFESDDTETRSQALVNLLCAFGNAITQTMETRVREHHRPQFVESFASSQNEVEVARAVNTDFYGSFPELANYKGAVTKAFEIVAGLPENKGQPYSETMRNQVGNLARAAIESSGINLPARGKPAAAPANVSPPAAPAAAVQPFEAGGARPAQGGSENGPADLVAELSAWA